MTHWWVTYWLADGCVVRVHTLEKHKRTVGDTWACAHGEQEIVKEAGHGA